MTVRTALVEVLSSHLMLLKLAGGGSAISAEANVVRKAAAEVLQSFEQSQALFGEKTGALSQLAVLAAECAEQGWDGESAAALDPVAILWAERFVRALPDSIPLPELAPEPDGSISLDWIASGNHLFSVSVGRSGRLAFAWLDGTDHGHGVACFEAQSVPRQVLDRIQRLGTAHPEDAGAPRVQRQTSPHGASPIR